MPLLRHWCIFSAWHVTTFSAAANFFLFSLLCRYLIKQKNFAITFYPKNVKRQEKFITKFFFDKFSLKILSLSLVEEKSWPASAGT
jgi:hypothetical protein